MGIFVLIHVLIMTTKIQMRYGIFKTTEIITCIHLLRCVIPFILLRHYHLIHPIKKILCFLELWHIYLLICISLS